MRDGWIEVTFGEVFTIVAGKYVAKKDYVEGGKYWIYGSNSVMGQLDDFLVETSHVVMAAIGAYAGAVRYSREPSWINNNAMALVPDINVSAQYLYYWLESQFDLKRVVVGTGQPYVQRPLLLKEVIALPPLIEQKRIVDLISSVDSYIESLQRQLESAKKSRNAVLHDLLTAGGDGWIETTLDDIASVTMGQSPKGDSYNILGEGLPFMQGSAEFGEHYPAPEKWCSEPKKIAEPGDLLLSVRAPVGDTNFADQRIAVGRGLSIVRANEKSVTEFIRLVIQLNVSAMIASSGTGMFASITGKNLKDFKVFLPPFAEQTRIVDIISSIDHTISQLQKSLFKSAVLRSGLLSDLLSGKHEIPSTYDEVMDFA
jgi:type I restriction enzyme S subunit